MRRLNYCVSLLLVVILVTFTKCDKEEDSVTVEYTIVPMNTYFTSITYRDASGATVVINDYNQFTGGSRTITVDPPFTARMEANANNTSSASVNYVLAIKVDGEIKQTTPVNLPPGVVTTSAVEFAVQ